MEHLCKSQLQAYALKQNLDLPVYATEHEGPPHAPRFRSKVTFCGRTFQSHEFFSTLKSAEHSAAKIALASITPSSPQGIDVVVYKNMLQEIAHKEGSLLPTYATATSGPSHAPAFITTVEFSGRFFRGEEAKTKKLAEMSAAKVAYMSITSGNLDQPSSPSSPFERQEAPNSDLQSIQREIPSQPSKIVTPDVPSKWIEVYDDELPDVLVAPANKAKEKNVAASPVPGNPTNVGTLSAPTPIAMEISNATYSSSPMLKNPTSNGNETTSCVKESEKKLIMGTGHLSIPSGQHVVCRPWNPEMTLPQDAEMIVRDDRFIAYRLTKH